MILKRTSIKEIIQIIDELNHSMVTGLDNVLNNVIKDGKDVLTPLLRRMVDLSIMKGEYTN